MSGSTTPWLLAGALAASLGWNLLQLRDAPAPAAAPHDSGCLDAARRAGIDLGSGERRARLEGLLRQCEERCSGDESRASAIQAALFAAIRAEPFDAAAVRARAAELAQLRSDAVARAADAMVELRGELGAEPFVRLLDTCCGDGCADGGCGSCATGGE